MMKKIFQDGISVIICCYNSSKRLPETLKNLASQEVYHAISWEVIVVNNNSTDNTKEVAYAEWAKYNSSAIKFIVVDQPLQGLSAARQKGLDSSKFSYIVFCDDDNWLAPNYLSESYKILTDKPEVGAAGGWSEPVYDNTPPEWFNSFALSCAVGKPREEDGYCKYVWGAGLVLRREAYERLLTAGFKSILIGRKGKELSSGEDEELCLALQLIGYKVYYTKKLFFSHYIPKERQQWAYFKKLYFGLGKSKYGLFPYSFILDNIPLNKKYMWLRVLKYVLKDIFFNLPCLFYFRKKGNHKVLQLYGNLGFIQNLFLLNNTFDKNLHYTRKMSEWKSND